MKRAADEGASTASPKKVKTTPLDPTYHLIALLEHIVNDIIPNAWMDTVGKRALYQDVVDDPAAAIKKMKELVNPWVIEYYEAGVLYDPEYLEKKAVARFEAKHGLYVAIIRIPSSWRRYVGQSVNCEQRVHNNHENEKYRNSHPSLHYMYQEIAEELFWLSPGYTPDDLPAGLLNIMELWQAMLFRSLQKSELKKLLPREARGIADEDLELGAKVRNPLEQGLNFSESPDMGYYRFKNSPDPHKQAFFEKMKDRSVRDKRWWADRDAKRQGLLRGDIYKGTFGASYHSEDARKGEDRMFTLHYAYILFDTTTWRRWDESTIRVKCKLVPEGEVHPHCVVKNAF